LSKLLGLVQRLCAPTMNAITGAKASCPGTAPAAAVTIKSTEA
jgi:hypothetical protein